MAKDVRDNPVEVIPSVSIEKTSCYESHDTFREL